MTTLYLICLIVGGGLLLLTLLGGDADADAAEVDLGAEVDVDTDVGGAAGADGWHAGLFGADTMAHEFFSIRALIYFLAGFGATGFLLETLAGASAGAALVAALATGVVAAGVAALIYGWLRRSESGIVSLDPDGLSGVPAEVVLPVVSGRRGKVRAIVGDREVELLARLHGADDADCPRGTSVVIVEIDGDTALVAPMTALPPETR